MSVEIALAASILSLIAAAIRLLNDITLGKKKSLSKSETSLEDLSNRLSRMERALERSEVLELLEKEDISRMKGLEKAKER
ncbi:MAG: hypothetical protein QXO94_05960 [Candidatus Bathyarchaeia archaeon]